MTFIRGSIAGSGDYLKGSLQKLGPVFVKAVAALQLESSVGQTLAQRPDIVGDDAAEVLKSLQSKTKPFLDEIARLET
eukprot:Skav213480  [mRNA]  locus=scaffold565:178524:179698:+ [translate_table: standard]